jgi:sensor histidine kinase YesM
VNPKQRQLLITIVAPILAWTTICALIASNAYVRRSPESTRTWFWSFADQSGFYLPFILVTWGVIFLSARHIKRQTARRRLLLIHLGLSLLWMAIYGLYAIGWFMWMRGIEWQHYWEAFTMLHGINSLSDYAIYWIITATIYSWRFSAQVQQQERERNKLALQTAALQTQLAVSRLETLKSQLQPHFLFNTLNSISSLFRMGDQAKGLKTLSTLSDLLRYVLHQDGGLTVTLREELKLIDLYLNIEQVRFEDHLKIERSIDPTSQDQLIPSMLLQPLVENAVRHGISQRLQPGTLKITTQMSDGALEIQIYNDGPPLPLQQKEQEGKGLSITRVRIQQSYGEKGCMIARNIEDQGVMIELTLPTGLLS